MDGILSHTEETMFYEHWLSWTILFIIILILFYTLIVVAEEKDTFIENAQWKKFHQFNFPTPSWWTLVKESPLNLTWERTDTRYDWKCNLQKEESLANKSIEEDFKDRIEELGMIFDLESSDILMPEDFKDSEDVIAGNLEIVRIEGTATQNGTERCYLDAFLVRDLKNKETLFATSHSSVLNGLVEGPYFEYMMLNLRYEG